MSNEVSKFEKEINLILSKNFFFKEPEKNKILLYSISYLITTYLGIVLNLWLLVTIFTMFYLCYILGAGGLKYFIPLGILTSVGAYFFGDLYVAFWISMHTLIALIFYFMITNRYSKISIILYSTVFLFFSLAIFVTILLKTGYISYSPKDVQTLIDSYIDWAVNAQPSLQADKNLLIQSFEEIKISFPVILFSYLFIYILLLTQITLAQLSKEKVIIPVFPKFSKIILSYKFTMLYLFINIVLIFTTNSNHNRYDIVSLILENFMGIIRWAFVFNGLFTIYFFIEQKNKKGIFLKVICFVLMYIFSFLFEMIGIIDSIFKIREYYFKNSGGKL